MAPVFAEKYVRLKFELKPDRSKVGMSDGGQGRCLVPILSVQQSAAQRHNGCIKTRSCRAIRLQILVDTRDIPVLSVGRRVLTCQTASYAPEVLRRLMIRSIGQLQDHVKAEESVFRICKDNRPGDFPQFVVQLKADLVHRGEADEIHQVSGMRTASPAPSCMLKLIIGAETDLVGWQQEPS